MLASRWRRRQVALMIHDVSLPSALIAGLVSFLSPCVLPLVPPYLVYLTGATIEHVSNDATPKASKRAVLLAPVTVVPAFSTRFFAPGPRAPTPPTRARPARTTPRTRPRRVGQGDAKKTSSPATSEGTARG